MKTDIHKIYLAEVDVMESRRRWNWSQYQKSWLARKFSACGLNTRFRELIVYCLIGATGAGLDIVMFALLTSFTSIHYQVANVISVSLGIADSFLLNYYFNFNVKDKFVLRFVSFYSVCLFGMIVQMAILFVLIEKAGMASFWAKFCALCVITVLQFGLNKMITFRKKTDD